MSHPDTEIQSVRARRKTSFANVLEARLSRRQMLQGAVALAIAGSVPMSLGGCATAGGGLRREGSMSFKGIATSTADTVRVPEGYSASAFYRWGDPVGHVSGSPAFKPDASNNAAEQALQAGMHHDGIHYYPLPYGSDSSTHALLAINHEYTDDGMLHRDGYANWSAEKVRKSQNAVRPSKYARRITAATPMRIAGPAAGDVAMKTSADPAGVEVLGTVNNCAHGYTPWGTYLTCEENFDSYFVNTGKMLPDHQRNGISPKGGGYRWHEFDERFDAGKHPNEPNRFGWVVEIDPYDPRAVPIKRTTLGRMAHEGAWYAPANDGRAVFYMGDDRAFEYVYKFVTRDRVNKSDRNANRDLLDHGTLYVARYHADGSGEWLELTHGKNGLTVAAGFASQADVLIRSRAAADTVGGTPMDRPEWIAVHPSTNEVYCTLTSNTARGARERPAGDAANPRSPNPYGHIIRWREQGNDPAALKFRWDMFMLAGDPQNADSEKRGNIKGDWFGSADGLWFDDGGLLWIQTDVSTSTLGRGDYVNMGNNQMLCADIRTGEVRRFLTGPRGCEVTGVITTPDGKSMFVNIQHPGEPESGRTDPAKAQAVSTWPDGAAGGRPRSATIVIRKNDGGLIGT
jgi:uncharacterized protein